MAMDGKPYGCLIRGVSETGGVSPLYTTQQIWLIINRQNNVDSLKYRFSVILLTGGMYRFESLRELHRGRPIRVVDDTPSPLRYLL